MKPQQRFSDIVRSGCLDNNQIFDSIVDSSKKRNLYTEDNHFNFTKEQWPPYSPDISSNDYFLWTFKNSNEKVTATSREELLKITKCILSNIPLEIINRALESWPDRVYKVHLANDRHIEDIK